MAPKKVDNLVTLKGANPLTLWRPKRGQPNNSPAYMYIYIYGLGLVLGPPTLVKSSVLKIMQNVLPSLYEIKT